MSEQTTYRRWAWHGRNGSWTVEEYHEIDEHWHSGTFGQIPVGSKREALTVASALNEAYAAGRREGVGHELYAKYGKD